MKFILIQQRYYQISILSILMVVISGCKLSSTPNSNISTAPLMQRSPVNYQAAGRIAIKTVSDSGQVSFTWEAQNQLNKIVVSGPLGQGGFSATLTPSLVDAVIDGKRITSNNPDQFFKEVVKINLPALSIKHWLAGQANDPSTAVIDKNSQHVVQIIENGWVIDYPEWQNIEGSLLPKRIVVTQLADAMKQISQPPETQAKIVINSWKL